MTTGKETALERVYGSTNIDDLTDAYSGWAADYDRETAERGYLLPFFITAFVARHVPRSDGPILDAGCGTGLSGPSLVALGYPEIEGLDMSREMLEVAISRNVYKRLAIGRLGEDLPFHDDYFAAVIASGVFTLGHAPAEGFRELARVTRPGGHVIATVRDSILTSDGFRKIFTELEKTRRWQVIEETKPFRAFALAEPEATVRCFVFRVI
ncbi:MAG: class I SAM-dependent methyltransferase [Rhizobiaceae bacterium]|nr:class I SAM-dependent methyltransferase [Rhizobiaceae bacterium]MCV0407356.1 class I SAM-dependent methyltransferase [Rhizobiaceae bacterium]